jgi:BlaI family transcriptional regulator, penicillinase repressor
MARQKSQHLTRLELEIMNVLWDTGGANVQTVQQNLKRELAYTTVQTMLNILLRKGKVKRALVDRAYVYKAVVTKRQFVSRHLGDLVDRLFGGSAESLVVSLVEAKHLTPQKLTKLNKILKEQEEKKDAND